MENPIAFRDDDHRLLYTTNRVLGRWGVESLVYVAREENDDMEVILKVAKESSAQDYTTANEQVNRSLLIPIPNLGFLPVSHHFLSTDNSHGEKAHCIVFSLYYWSMRTMIYSCTKFQNGLPEQVIAICLKQFLESLNTLHGEEAQQLHGRVSAGALMCGVLVDPDLKIAYAATIYDPIETLNPYDFTYSPVPLGTWMSTNELPIQSIVDWGRAPEITEQGDNYTTKSEIWCIGVTALELAYGKISVANRDKFLAITHYIRKKKKLPNTWEELRLKAQRQNLWMKIHGSFKKKPKVEKRFSRNFAEKISKCFKNNPEKRPAANEFTFRPNSPREQDMLYLQHEFIDPNNNAAPLEPPKKSRSSIHPGDPFN